MLCGVGAFTGVSASDGAQLADQLVVDRTTPRDFPIRPIGPLGIGKQRQDRPALVGIGAAVAVGSVGVYRKQDGIAADALPNFGGDLDQPIYWAVLLSRKSFVGALAHNISRAGPTTNRPPKDGPPLDPKVPPAIAGMGDYTPSPSVGQSRLRRFLNAPPLNVGSSAR